MVFVFVWKAKWPKFLFASSLSPQKGSSCVFEVQKWENLAYKELIFEKRSSRLFGEKNGKNSRFQIIVFREKIFKFIHLLTIASLLNRCVKFGEGSVKTKNYVIYNSC